jgi:hypothetical protein
MRGSRATLLLACLLVSGCLTADPVARAMHRSSTTVERSIRTAHLASEDPQIFALQARYNPCLCAAPDFEIYLYGAWHRHILEGEGQLLESLFSDAQTLELNGTLGRISLRGSFGGWSRLDSGGEFPVFVVDAYLL